MVTIVSRGQIETPLEARLIELFGLLAGLVERGLGKGISQAEFVDDRERVDARRSSGTEDLREHSLPRLDMRREAEHFDNHLVVRSGALRAWVAHEDRLAERSAVDLDVSLSVALQIGADKLPGRPREHLLDDAAALARVPAGAGQPHQHLVAGMRVAHIGRRDEDFGLATFRDRLVRPDIARA